MKMRFDFITNSSSSSFIVILDKIPKDVNELKVILFGSQEFYVDPYADCYGRKNLPTSWYTEEVAKTVYNDMVNNIFKVGNNKKIRELLYSVYSGDQIDMHDVERVIEKCVETSFVPSECLNKECSFFDDSCGIGCIKTEYDWNRYDDLYEKGAYDWVNEVINENLRKFMFIVEYSDNDGQYFCALEHGDLFKNVKHYVMNNH